MHPPGGNDNDDDEGTSRVDALTCPGCSQSMQTVDLDRVLTGTVTIDLCRACQALWFDAFESGELAPAGTLQLFRAIYDATPDPRAPLPSRLPCPRCTMALVVTQDITLHGRITYHRCPNGHGRFTPFVQFLREKNFLRAVPPADLEQLKSLVRIVRCSSCGAPIDLAHDTACAYCHAPITILDPAMVAKTLRELDTAAARRVAIGSPEAASAAMLESARFDHALAQERMHDDGSGAADLIGFGLNVLASVAFR